MESGILSTPSTSNIFLSPKKSPQKILASFEDIHFKHLLYDECSAMIPASVNEILNNIGSIQG